MADPKITRYQTGPPFPPYTHLLFVVPKERPGIGCAICRRPETRECKHDFCCESCGLPLHSECHWTRVATARERALYARISEDAARREADAQDYVVSADGVEYHVSVSEAAGEEDSYGLGFWCQGCRS